MTTTGRPTGHRWFAAIYDPMTALAGRRLSRLRRLAAGGAYGRVLEIGAGTGANLPFYDWARVTALDLAEPDAFMRARAEKKAAALPEAVRAKVRLQDAAAESLPFEADAYDTLVSTLVLCTVGDPEAAAREAMRVLRPGGELRLLEHVAAGGFAGRVQRTVQPVYGHFSAGCNLHRQTEATLRSAGFSLDVRARFFLGPLLPAVFAVALKPPLNR